MKSKKQNAVISVFFCSLLLAGTAAGFLTPDRTFSETEKRTLAQLPEVSLRAIGSGQFGTEMESYLSDQFPARNSWITVKTLTELIGGKRDAGGVYFCDDGYLMDKQTSYNVGQYRTNLDTIKALSDRLETENIPVEVLLVPTAAEILSEKLPAFAPHLDQAAMLQTARDKGLHLIDPTANLEAHKSEDIYYKTDHHYTSLGAYYCYSAWKADKGQTAEPLSAWSTETLCQDFRGTTYAKVNYPYAPFDTITAYFKNTPHTVTYNGGEYVTDSIYERSYLDGKDQYAVFFNSNQPTTVVSGGGQGTLLILKDSYANTFAQFVIDDYAETHLIDLRYYKESIQDYIQQHGITEVLVLYNLPGFAGDMGIMKLAAAASPKN